MRAEARFALQFGAAILVLGVILALVLGALALPPAPKLTPLYAALIAAPPVLIGWGMCAFASWRLELVQRLEREPDLALSPARSKIETMRRFIRPEPRRSRQRQSQRQNQAAKARGPARPRAVVALFESAPPCLPSMRPRTRFTPRWRP